MRTKVFFDFLSQKRGRSTGIRGEKPQKKSGPVSGPLSRSARQSAHGSTFFRGRAIPKPECQPHQSEGSEISRQVFQWFRGTPIQPSQTYPIRPRRNPHLVTAEKSNRGSDAANRRPARKILFEPISQLFLGTAAGAEEQKPGTSADQNIQQSRIDHRAFAGIGGRDVAICCFNWNSNFIQPLDISQHGLFGRHHPESGSGNFQLRPFQKDLQKSQARNTRQIPQT